MKEQTYSLTQEESFLLHCMLNEYRTKGSRILMRKLHRSWQRQSEFVDLDISPFFARILSKALFAQLDKFEEKFHIFAKDFFKLLNDDFPEEVWD